MAEDTDDETMTLETSSEQESADILAGYFLALASHYGCAMPFVVAVDLDIMPLENIRTIYHMLIAKLKPIGATLKMYDKKSETFLDMGRLN